MKKLYLRFVLVFFAFLINSASPQWSTDPTTNLAICTSDQTQRETEICNDNEGNVYIFWRDYRNEPTIFGGDIYAQKLNEHGVAQWSAEGISIETKAAAQFDIKALYDGNDGIYLVWREAANLFSDYKIYAQRITLDGAKLWGSNGILLQTFSGTAVSHSIFVNEDGDLLVSWQLDLATPNSVDIYAQKINRDGVVQWNSNGLLICNGTARSVYGSQIISNQNGGAYVCWSDNRTDLSNFDIYAQRISSGGNTPWAQNGICVSNHLENQHTKHIISDNDGCAMIFWEEFQPQGYVVTAQRIDSSGYTLSEKLLYFSTNPLTQYEFIKAKDDKIYFIYTTSDHNTFTQILDYDGNYVSNGEIPVCTTQSSVSNLSICPSDVNGVVITWQDNRNGNNDIYTQWINSEGYGLVMWNSNGVTVCTENSEQTDYDICSDGLGGAVIAWADMRNGNFDIYAQNIDVRGKLGSNRYLFQKSGLNKTISNTNPTTDSLFVTLPLLKGEEYSSVTVLIDSIMHPDLTEIKITLKHLAVIDTIIYELPGGENLITCLLDDYAVNSISSSTPPYSGIYKPYKPLTAFLSTDLNGEWIIEIEDNFAGDDGTLKSWGLIFNKDNITNIDYNPRPNLVKDFILYQNYPNPFNPSTKISWQSPVSGWQTLKVFDVLGNEVAMLVDEYKPAGMYNVQFTMYNLASGIYFYQLKAGDPSTSSGQSFIQTKKMVLLR